MRFLAFCVPMQGPGLACTAGTLLLLRLLKLANAELWWGCTGGLQSLSIHEPFNIFQSRGIPFYIFHV